MKTLLISFIFLMQLPSFISCKDNKENNYLKESPENLIMITFADSLFFNEFLNSEILDFIADCECKQCIYELYVDKKEKDYFNITLTCLKSSDEYLKLKKPQYYSIYNTHRFYIYSGLEDLVNSKSSEDLHKVFFSEYLIQSRKLVVNSDTSFAVDRGWPPYVQLPLLPTITFE